MITVEDAFERIISAAKPKEPQTVALDKACRRILAADIVARRSQPASDVSAMDGYAVRSSSLNPDAHLNLVGEVPAGQTYAGTVQEGEAVRIYTGAPVPAGADQVVMQEDVRVDADALFADSPPMPGKHIRPKGQDFTEGDCVMRAGRSLLPHTLGLLASAGFGRVPVHGTPRVQIITTGDEIVDADSRTFSPSETVDSAGPMVRAMLSAAGAVVDGPQHVPDDSCKLTEILTGSLTEYDLTITIGGASVGARDYVHSALENSGASRDFWKISMQPGKPLIFGHKDNRLFIGLPGNAVSAFVCAYLYARPLIDKFLGRRACFPRAEQLPLVRDLPAVGGRTQFLRAHLVEQSGEIKVAAAEAQDSSLVRVLAESDGLIMRAIDSPAAPAGSLVPFLPFH